MSVYNPDVWVVIKVSGEKVSKTHYRVLAGWYGGYLGSDSWKLNSGITKIVDKDSHYEIHGDSGSIYNCGKDLERLSSYTAGILAGLKKHANGYTVDEVEISEILSEFS